MTNYASLVGMMNYLADSIKPEIFINTLYISNPDLVANIQYNSDKKIWIVKTNGSDIDTFDDALNVVGFLFKSGYSLMILRRELEELTTIEAIYSIKRYRGARDILGKERIESAVVDIERTITGTKKNPPAKLTLIKNEE